MLLGPRTPEGRPTTQIDEDRLARVVTGVWESNIANLENSINELRNSIDFTTTKNNHENIIMVDFNINYKLIHSHPFKLLKEIERDFGVKQIIDKDTRITARSFTLIDLILTDCQNIQESCVLNICISDHCAFYMVKKKKNTTKLF